jgi:rod shape-determining protein MreD
MKISTRHVVVIILFLAALVFNETLMPAIALGGVSPNLIIYFVIFTALVKRPYQAAFWGAVVGLVEDLMIGRYIGLSILSYAFAAYVIAYLRARFYQENLLMPLLAVFIGSFIFGSLYLVLAQIIAAPLPFTGSFISDVLPQSLYNTALSLAVYVPMQFILHRMQVQREYKRYHYRKYH